MVDFTLIRKWGKWKRRIHEKHSSFFFVVVNGTKEKEGVRGVVQSVDRPRKHTTGGASRKISVTEMSSNPMVLKTLKVFAGALVRGKEMNKRKEVR